MRTKYKNILNKSLNKAIRDLKKSGLIDSPVFYVKSKKQDIPIIVYKPSYDEDVIGNREGVISKIQQICNNEDAKEVLMLSDVFVHDNSPPSEAIYVSLERRSKIYSVLQPYSVNDSGAIKFHEQSWEISDKKGSLGDFECFVK
jgi:hypothetical protein